MHVLTESEGYGVCLVASSTHRRRCVLHFSFVTRNHMRSTTSSIRLRRPIAGHTPWLCRCFAQLANESDKLASIDRTAASTVQNFRRLNATNEPCLLTTGWLATAVLSRLHHPVSRWWPSSGVHTISCGVRAGSNLNVDHR